MDIKHIDIKEFREKGYLQELNRQFLHPLGLALEIIIEDNGSEKINGIWDYREDQEGIFYDLKNSNEKRIKSFIKKSDFIKNEFEERKKKRKELLGFDIEPIIIKKEN
jgi:hypothetical protein